MSIWSTKPTTRHAAFAASEVCRVLTLRGRFLTQQVGGQSHTDLTARFQSERTVAASPWCLCEAMRILEGAGLEVVAGQEAFPETAFYDIGAVVYYLRAIPWQVPDFRVEKYTRTLRALHCQIKQEGQWVVRGHRFYLEAWRR